MRLLHSLHLHTCAFHLKREKNFETKTRFSKKGYVLCVVHGWLDQFSVQGTSPTISQDRGVSYNFVRQDRSQEGSSHLNSFGNLMTATVEPFEQFWEPYGIDSWTICIVLGTLQLRLKLVMHVCEIGQSELLTTHTTRAIKRRVLKRK